MCVMPRCSVGVKVAFDVHKRVVLAKEWRLIGDGDKRTAERVLTLQEHTARVFTLEPTSGQFAFEPREGHREALRAALLEQGWEVAPPQQEEEAASKPLVTEDDELLAFWATARTAAMGEGRPLELPPLSFVALRDYLVHAFFTGTAVHELLGNILMDVSVCGDSTHHTMPYL